MKFWSSNYRNDYLWRAATYMNTVETRAMKEMKAAMMGPIYNQESYDFTIICEFIYFQMILFILHVVSP